MHRRHLIRQTYWDPECMCCLETAERSTLPALAESRLRLSSGRYIYPEVSNGGPTKTTGHLRTVPRTLCEGLNDYKGAIAAYLGVTTECRDLLQPWCLFTRCTFKDGPSKDAAYVKLIFQVLQCMPLKLQHSWPRQISYASASAGNLKLRLLEPCDHQCHDPSIPDLYTNCGVHLKVLV